MKGWIPVPGSSKGALALLALEEFGRNGFEAVNVVDLTARAGLTTGSLYHHFGNKLGLYGFVRDEAEQRIFDRMEGALEASGGEGVRRALLVCFDAAVRHGIGGLLSEPDPRGGKDRLEALLASHADPHIAPLLMAAWRAALAQARTHPRSVEKIRAALTALFP